MVDESSRRRSVQSTRTKSLFTKLAISIHCSATFCATGAWGGKPIGRVRVNEKKIELFSIVFKFVINYLSSWQTSITWTHHFAIPSLLTCFVSSEQPLFFDPEILSRTHHLTKLIARTIIPKTTLFEFPLVPNFGSKIKKNFIHFSLLIRTMNHCPWLWETLLLSIFFVFHTEFSVFSEQKIKLSSTGL